MQILTSPRFLKLIRASTRCRNCQIKLLHTSPSFWQTQNNQSKEISALGLPSVNISSKRNIAPRFLKQDFVAKPLGAPIGISKQPQQYDDPFEEENRAYNLQGGGLKGRLDRNTAIRKNILKDMDRSHVRDYKNISKAPMGGKFYLGNKALYKNSSALYWPNLIGKTLSGSDMNTTQMLQGKTSIVCLFQRQWAYDQSMSFVSAKSNPELDQILKENSTKAQLIELSMENIQAVGMFGWLFQWVLRRQRSKRQQENYMLVSGLPQSLKDSLGIMNNSVGYVFLIDQNCKIRWSGCAQATEDERQVLTKGLKSLVNREISIKAK